RCAVAAPPLPVPLRDVLSAPPDPPNAALIPQTRYAQPALFALGAALHPVFTQAGIHPDYLLGHSIGELTAAYLAGVFTLADAAVLVAARGRLMQACPPGAMLAIGAGPTEVDALLGAHPDTTIAAINGPHAVLGSGPPDQLDHTPPHFTTHDHPAT